MVYPFFVKVNDKILITNYSLVSNDSDYDIVLEYQESSHQYKYMKHSGTLVSQTFKDTETNS